MSLNNTSTENKSKKSRPLGVWVLTMFGLFFGGIFPLSFEPLDLLKGYTAFYSSEDIPIIKIMAFLNVTIVLTSIMTWKGSKIGRIFFLTFLAIFFVRDGVLSFLWGSRIPEFSDIQGWFRYIIDFGFPVFCIWYFNRPSTKEFYKKLIE